jgi:hypothetical protein
MDRSNIKTWRQNRLRDLTYDTEEEEISHKKLSNVINLCRRQLTIKHAKKS